MIVDESRMTRLGNDGWTAPAGSLTDSNLARRLSAYKRTVAGNYRSVSPGDMVRSIPTGEQIVSEKVDGETWFLHIENGGAVLVSPSGKVIVGIPLLDKAKGLVGKRTILASGELYAAVDHGRPHVHDLHAALGGGTKAEVDRLRFAAFDLLQDGDQDAQQWPFAKRAERLRELFGKGEGIHPARFENATSPAEVAAAYDRIVTKGGAEGIVIRLADGRIFKAKPEIAIDAAVVGFAENGGRVSELLLALMDSEGRFHLIGRVRSGFSEKERRSLFDSLSPSVCESRYRLAGERGVLYRWVKPQMVVEVKCNDLLAHRANDDPIRRMALKYSVAKGWTPLGPVPAISMINTVFVRMRDDKSVNDHDLRFSQVTDQAPVENEKDHAQPLPASEMVRRGVFTKQRKAGLALRKLVVWKTNKETIDPAYPPWVAYFTDFSPGRETPLKTDIRVASTREKIEAHADLWIASKIKQGWKVVSQFGAPAKTGHKSRAAREKLEQEVVALASNSEPPSASFSIAISFGRSPSVNFGEALRRVKKLAGCGHIRVESDDLGRLRHIDVILHRDIVRHSSRIVSLIALVRTWKSAEIEIAGDPLEGRELDSFLYHLREIRRCWRSNRKEGCEGSGSRLGCRMLRIEALPDFLSYTNNLQPWWAVGTFNGGAVSIDKDALRAQVQNERNDLCHQCPLHNHDEIEKRIVDLPDALDPQKDGQWMMLFHRSTGEPAWVAPTGLYNLPWALVREGEAKGGMAVHVGSGASAPPVIRKIPPTRYDDVRGQDSAVEAVRDYVEMPIKHAELFKHIGTQGGRGVLFYGAPGNGKTLLAKAVAGESGAHIEIVSGPEVLSKWVGESEERMRTIFARARKLAPSVILFDEIDAVASARSLAEGQHHKTLVSQLLVLLDGLEERGRIFVIGTTNRPDDIDPALRRPGRFDRMIHMGPPSIDGRAAIFEKHMTAMKVHPDVDPQKLARLTPNLSGAQIELTCREAGMNCVKRAVRDNTPLESVEVRMDHFEKAISIVAGQTTNSSASKSKGNGNGVIRPRPDPASPWLLRNE